MKSSTDINRQQLVQYSRQLRKNLTFPEQKLWHLLRSEQLHFKFRRQFIIGSFIVDFYCPKAKLIIEIDGESHGEQKEYDEHRTLCFKKLGMTILRFTNKEIIENIDGVFFSIQQHLPSAVPHPNPPLHEGRE